MTKQRAVTPGFVRAAASRVAAITAVIVVLAVASSVAHADNVTTLMGQLDDRSDKVRLSAALNLTKLGDPRAILALAKRVSVDNESSKNVRSAAAVGLAQLVDAKVQPNIRKLVISALEKAAASDPSEFVKAQAEKALDKIGAGSSKPTPSGGGGGGSVYVNVGPMSSKTGSAKDPKFRTMMVTVSGKTLTRVASDMAQTWAGGGAPSKQALAAKGFQGFYVDGTLNELKIEKAGSSSTVTCKISMLLASYPDKSVFGFLNGGAKVQASASPRDIDLASEDCVSAVVEDLIAKKIVPTIKAKASN